ncbi:hypothetical protein MYSE111917_24510 [Mycobacterium senriense]|uniref:DUF2599 domain-containing protein n=1 Tax=Mycobacterium senriense TaxID=2775496 RepID=A0ABM7SN19_9MYCO|nr:hypothetical protein [Mycobacterium senriense]BCZ21359.1 hypothetical protein MTY59_12140 [Mycobacterium senriense]
MATVALASVIAYVYHRANQPDIVVLQPVDAQGNVENGWTEDTSRANQPIDCSFGSPSRYDKSAGVRDCGASADSGDACWPAADGTHVLCLIDPFSHVLYRIRAQGLNTPRKPLAGDPIPFALQLDDGTQCRVRIGGAWDRPTEHPNWVGHYACHDPSSISSPRTFSAVWGPPDQGIDKGFGGWSVSVGPADGHLATRKVAKAFYVAVAAQTAAASDSPTEGQGGTRLVTKCGRTPQFQPEAIRTDSGGLMIRMKIVALCPGGDVLISPQTTISVTSGGQDVAAGVFDLSKSPIVIPPGSGTSSQPAVEHEFRFPLGSFWRLPVSTQQAPTSGAPQTGPTDLNVQTLVVACQETPSTVTTAPVTGTTRSNPTSIAVGPAPPPSGDNESASFDALRALANADRPFVIGSLVDRWVPQLSSKRPGLVADGITWDNVATLREHLQMRLQYPEVRLLRTGDWSTFSVPDFWVTIAGVVFSDADGALAWCRDHHLDHDHCYAKLVSTTHPVDGTTAFNP